MDDDAQRFHVAPIGCLAHLLEVPEFFLRPTDVLAHDIREDAQVLRCLEGPPWLMKALCLGSHQRSDAGILPRRVYLEHAADDVELDV